MKQKKALAILKSGRNVFLTGSAGAGKTYVLNQYIKYLRERKVKVAVTASTGIAATHMNGMTLHAWSGIGIKSSISLSQMKLMKTKKYLCDNLENVKVLIIDEISMLHKNQLDLVNQVLQFFKEDYGAFGGIQVVFSGDFFQLPPVGNQGESNRDKFAFMSKAWLEAELAICYLTEQHRQKENELTTILNEIRSANLSTRSIELLQQAQNTQLDDGLEPPKLFSHNMDVDRINTRHLLGLDTKSHSYEAKTTGNKKLLETLKKSASAPEKLRIKIGAKVMFARNNYDKGYINGTLGVVTKYAEDNSPIVKTLDGKKIYATPEVWSIDDDSGSPLASITQVPLKLAWAITVHKSQGMTLDAAEIDLSKTFERGQGYVALSRIKSLEGLRLLGFNRTALEVDALALKADKRFQELSTEAENESTEDELKQKAIRFLKSIGGLVDKKEIDKHKKKKAEKKIKKSTFLISAEYIEAGLSIPEIADKRGLSEGTINGHVVRVKKDYPHIDISRFKPDQEIFNKVKKAHDKLMAEDKENFVKADGSVSQKAIFDELNATVDYSMIKLTMAFI